MVEGVIQWLSNVRDVEGLRSSHLGVFVSTFQILPSNGDMVSVIWQPMSHPQMEEGKRGSIP